MNNITMKAKDSISAKLAECFVTVGSNRYNFMQAMNLEANFENPCGSSNISKYQSWLEYNFLDFHH